MRYVSTTVHTNFRDWSKEGGWASRLLHRIFQLISFGNSPDHEPLYPKVKKWLLEVNDDPIGVRREIGLGQGDTPLFAAPIGRNPGWWAGPDLDYDLTDDQIHSIDAHEFERLWSVCSSSKTGVPPIDDA